MWKWMHGTPINKVNFFFLLVHYSKPAHITGLFNKRINKTIFNLKNKINKMKNKKKPALESKFECTIKISIAKY